MAKKCEICKVNPATVPDRNRMGRPINRICADCHSKRLVEDMKYIIQQKKEQKDETNDEDISS